MDRSTRLSLAEQIRSASAPVAHEITEAFLSRHPDWLTRYGDRARLMGVEDARSHMAFLAAALESGAPSAFAEYARWTAGVLESRGIARQFLSENLMQMRQALAARLPAEGSGMAGEYVRGALDALSDPPHPAAPADASAQDRLSLTRSIYLQAVLAGERVAALNVANEALRQGIAAVDLYVDVLQATLYEIGRLWETNRITVAHEHAATAITQFVAAHLYEKLDRTSAPKHGTFLMTGLEGELHSLGALMVADVLETRGWNVHYLGTNLPHGAILSAIRERQPDCVGISATMFFSVPAVRRLVEAVRGEWGHSKRIVLGGGAFRHAPDLWKDLGADGHARDLHEAMALV